MLSCNVCLQSFIQICAKSYSRLFWAETHPPFKFRGNLLSSFCKNSADKPANQPTNGQGLKLNLLQFVFCSISCQTSASGGQRFP